MTPKPSDSKDLANSPKRDLVKGSSQLVRRGLDEILGHALHPLLLRLEPEECIILPGTSSPILCAAISPDNSLIITGEESGSVKLWNASDLAQVEIVSEHEGPVTGVSFVGSANRAYSAGLDGVVRFLDRGRNNRFELPRMHPITASDVACGGSVVVVGESRLGAIDGDWRSFGDASIAACDSGFVSAWDIASHWGITRQHRLEQPLWRIDLASRKIDSAADYPQCPTFIRISPDARLVAFSRKVGGTNPGELDLVGLRDGCSDIPPYGGSPSYAPVAAEFSADGERIIIVTWQGLLLKEREVAQQKCSSILLEEYTHDPEEGWPHTLHSDTHWAPWWAPSAVCTSPDGSHLMLGSRYGKIRIYEIPNRRRMAQLVGHSGEVTAVKFFTGMKYALSAGMDCTLRIWKLPELA